MEANTVEQDVDSLMQALEEEHGDASVTPGGVSWLHTHYVPVRRLVTRVVKRLKSGGQPPGWVGEDRRSVVVANETASLGYVTWDVTPAGWSYLLDGLQHDEPDDRDRATGDADFRTSPIARTPVCAVTWSSRHTATLLPVLAELAARGIATTVVDLATDDGQRFPEGQGIAVVRPQEAVLRAEGGLPTGALRAVGSSRNKSVAGHQISVARLARVVSQPLVRSAGPTHPSWAAAVRLEQFLDHVLAQLRAQVLLCSNDTSPPGVLAVRAADRAGAETVYVQHGAWIDGQIPWRAQHCRHIAVMGARDVVTSRTWTRRADARTYVVGQPRFDALTMADRTQHRVYLETLLSSQAALAPSRIAVWACQPSGDQRLLGQVDVLVEGLREAGPGWGLVIAPHPAQQPSAFDSLLAAAEEIPVALADRDVGARGCLAGADALITTSSTCGIEAVLLDVPVLELTLPASRTLGLAEHRAAQRSASGADIATALAAVERTPAAVRVPAAAKEAICHWDGRAAQAVADIVSNVLSQGSTATYGPHLPLHSPKGA